MQQDQNIKWYLDLKSSSTEIESWNYYKIHTHTHTAAAAESLTNPQIPEKACIEKPFHVKGQPPNTLYPNIPIIETHLRYQKQQQQHRKHQNLAHKQVHNVNKTLNRTATRKLEMQQENSKLSLHSWAGSAGMSAVETKMQSWSGWYN